MRKTTGVRLKLIEFAPDMKRDGVGDGDGDSDYNLTWLDHGRRCFLFMLEMFSSINYAYTRMIWEERKPCRKTGTLNLFLFVRNALGTTPQKRVSRTAVSA